MNLLLNRSIAREAFVPTLSGIDIYSRGSPSLGVFDEGVNATIAKSELWIAGHSRPFRSGAVTNLGVKLTIVSVVCCRILLHYRYTG